MGRFAQNDFKRKDGIKTVFFLCVYYSFYTLGEVACVTVIVYSFVDVPFVTVTTTVFSESATQVQVVPVKADPFNLIATVASDEVAVAVIVFVAFDVEVVYSSTSASKVGDSVNEPKLNADSVVSGSGSGATPP